MRVSLLFAMVVVLNSCTTIEYQTVDLSAKLPPPLEQKTEEQLGSELGECVADDTYIYVIELYRREQTLRGLILSTSDRPK